MVVTLLPKLKVINIPSDFHYFAACDGHDKRPEWLSREQSCPKATLLGRELSAADVTCEVKMVLFFAPLTFDRPRTSPQRVVSLTI